jgi:hypothetical protein
METLAYLHVTEDYENSESKELNFSGINNKTALGMLGAAVAVVGVLGAAESAEASGKKHYYSYDPCYTPCYYYQTYFPKYYYYPKYHYYPQYYSYHKPCW